MQSQTMISEDQRFALVALGRDAFEVLTYEQLEFICSRREDGVRPHLATEGDPGEWVLDLLAQKIAHVHRESWKEWKIGRTHIEFPGFSQ